MNRILGIMFILTLGMATLAVGKARHTKYTMESEASFLHDPALYVVPSTTGWLLARQLPVGGEYSNSMNETGTMTIIASGKISIDFLQGSFYGSASLDIDGGRSCVGPLRATRVDGVETGRWVLECSDGSRMIETWQFDVLLGASSWPVTGVGRRLEPSK
jgi:hypothetical protein